MVKPSAKDLQNETCNAHCSGITNSNCIMQLHCTIAGTVAGCIHNAIAGVNCKVGVQKGLHTMVANCTCKSNTTQ